MNIFFQRIKLDVETKQPKFEEMKSLSSDFLRAGTHIMEPYRRLLERRWDSIQIKMKELEYALKSRKEEKDIVDAGRPRDEQVTVSRMVMVQSAPDSDDLWWSAEEEEVQKTPGKDLHYMAYTREYHTLTNHTVPYHTISYHTILYHNAPYCTTPHNTVPYYTIPHCNIQ